MNKKIKIIIFIFFALSSCLLLKAIFDFDYHKKYDEELDKNCSQCYSLIPIGKRRFKIKSVLPDMVTFKKKNYNHKYLLDNPLIALKCLKRFPLFDDNFQSPDSRDILISCGKDGLNYYGKIDDYGMISKIDEVDPREKLNYTWIVYTDVYF